MNARKSFDQDIGNWDVSLPRCMMFLNAQSLDQDLSNWDGVTNWEKCTMGPMV